METETRGNRPGLMARLGASGPVAIVLSIAPPIGGLLLLAALTSLGSWLRLPYEIGWLVCFFIGALLVGVSLVPTFTCGIIAGWSFGFVAGWPLSIATITAG